MANTLNVGLGVGNTFYYTPSLPFKDLIKHSQGAMRTNQVVSGVSYSRLIYAPSSFPNNVVTTESPYYVYTSEYSDENGWPTSLPYGRVDYFCLNELQPGLVSAILPPSSTDDANQATFHVLWDGQGEGGSRGWDITYNDTGPGPGNTFGATITDVSAGEAKFTGIDTTTLYSLHFRISSTDPNDHIRNVRIIHQDHRNNFESEPFNSVILDYHKSITTSGGGLRFMKWTRTNESSFGVMSSLNGDSFDLTSTLPITGTAQGDRLGMAYAWTARYANAADRDLWATIHYKADDASISAIASTLAAELDSNRKVYVELGNEWWNFAYPYNIQTSYFTEQAEANGGSSIYNLNYYGGATPLAYEMAQAYGVQRSIDVYNIFDNYFPANRLIKVLDGQIAAEDRNKGMLEFSGAYNHVNAFAINTYVGNIIGNNVSAASAVAASSWDVDRLIDYMYEAVSGAENIYIDDQNPVDPQRVRTVPLRLSVSGHADMLSSSPDLSGIDLISYEGGHHLDVGTNVQGSDRTFLLNLYEDAKYSPRWNDWIQFYCSSMVDYGLKTHTHFVGLQVWSPSDTTGLYTWFGVIPYPGQTTPTYSGLQTYVGSYSAPVDPPIVIVSRGKVNRIVRLHF